MGVSQEYVRSLSVVCQESDGNQIWRADLVSSPKKNLQFVFCESVGSLLGVSQESVKSLSGVCQESDWNQIWRADLDSSPNCDLLLSPINLDSVKSLLGVYWKQISRQCTRKCLNPVYEIGMRSF